MVELNLYLNLLLAIPAVCTCTQLLTFLGAYHAMQPYAFAAPPPSGSSVVRLTGAWDAAALNALRLGEQADDDLTKRSAAALDIDVKRQASHKLCPNTKPYPNPHPTSRSITRTMPHPQPTPSHGGAARSQRSTKRCF